MLSASGLPGHQFHWDGGPNGTYCRNTRTATLCPLIRLRLRALMIPSAISSGTSTRENLSVTSMAPRTRESKPASFAIVVSRSSARVQRIASRSTILGQASALVSAARSGRGVTNEAKALSATILTSIRELSSHRRVIISAEGSLQQVPFELLEQIQRLM